MILKKEKPPKNQMRKKEIYALKNLRDNDNLIILKLDKSGGHCGNG